MKTKEIKELSVEELQERVAQLKANLETLKINHAISPLDKPTEITKTRHTIAQLLTELTKRNNQQK